MTDLDFETPVPTDSLILGCYRKRNVLSYVVKLRQQVLTSWWMMI